jgi:hypothetical protein
VTHARQLSAPAPARREPLDYSPRRLAGWLPDGTPHHAPVGLLVEDGDRVCCHLCGNWFLSVASHLRVHGWTKADYIAAFGLEFGNPLTGQATHERRSAALNARKVSDETIRSAQLAARRRARTGELAAAAAKAARGRPHPAQRRPKTMAALAAIGTKARNDANTRRGRQHVEAVAQGVATRFGFADFGQYVADRRAAGASLAAISREAGQHKDWLSRHVRVLAPQVALREQQEPHEREWRAVAQANGFADVGCYLRTRHEVQHRTIAAIATEVGLSRLVVTATLARNGIRKTAHATKRHDAASRARSLAAKAGFDSITEYLDARRAVGLSWKAMAAEIGLPESSLRRQRR